MFLNNFNVLMSKIISKKLKKILKITTRKKTTNSLHKKSPAQRAGKSARSLLNAFQINILCLEINFFF